MSKMKRVERHVREAMVNHLGEGEAVVGVVFGHSSIEDDESSSIPLIGESEDHHLVIGDKRLYLVEFGDGFPAKKNDPVEPASLVTSRVRLVDEKIRFATKIAHFDDPRALITNVQVNQWLFHPATIGYIFDG